MFSPRLHRHAIFGDLPVSDTDTGTTHQSLVSERCPFFFVLLQHGGHASSEKGKKKKEKSQILTVTSESLESDTVKVETHRQSPVLDRADR